MRKKTSLLAVAALFATTALAGCGQSKPQIHFWAGFGGSISDSIGRIIDRYQEEHDEYEIVYKSDGTGYAGLQREINLSVSNEAYPHLAVGYPDHMAGYLSYNILKPLDSFIEADEDFDLDDFHEAYLVENQSLAYDEEEEGNPYTMGLPFNKSTEVMVVNQTFVDYMQTFDKSITIPETWEEAEVIGEKILAVMSDNELYGKTPEFRGKTLNFEFSEEEFRPFSWDSTENMFITIVREWGGVYTEAEDYLTGVYKFDSPETIEALTFFERLADNSIMGVPQTWGETGYSSNPFNANKTIFTISSSAGVKYNVPPMEAFEISVNPIPYHEGEKPMVISQGTNILMFDQGTPEEQDFAWNFMKHLTSEVNDIFAIENAYYPVTKSMQASETYVDFLANTDGKTAEELAVIDAANVNAQVYDAEGSEWQKFVDPGFVGSSEIRSTVGAIIPAFFTSDTSIEDAMDEAMSSLNRYKPN